jgi:hypothetical protein
LGLLHGPDDINNAPVQPKGYPVVDKAILRHLKTRVSVETGAGRWLRAFSTVGISRNVTALHLINPLRDEQSAQFST